MRRIGSAIRSGVKGVRRGVKKAFSRIRSTRRSGS